MQASLMEAVKGSLGMVISPVMTAAKKVLPDWPEWYVHGVSGDGR